MLLIRSLGWSSLRRPPTSARPRNTPKSLPLFDSVKPSPLSPDPRGREDSRHSWSHWADHARMGTSRSSLRSCASRISCRVDITRMIGQSMVTEACLVRTWSCGRELPMGDFCVIASPDREGKMTGVQADSVLARNNAPLYRTSSPRPSTTSM